MGPPSPVAARYTVASDASPWGIGAVVFDGCSPVAWLADGLGVPDFHRFHAEAGDPTKITVWEGLAILVALRTWLPCFSRSSLVGLRSDSLALLSSLSKGASRAPSINLILCEVSLVAAIHHLEFSNLVHIPGVANDWPDALSRMQAPEPRLLPEPLRVVPRSGCAPRTAQFYRTLRVRIGRPPGDE